jgi:hypothetical protein
VLQLVLGSAWGRLVSSSRSKGEAGVSPLRPLIPIRVGVGSHVSTRISGLFHSLSKSRDLTLSLCFARHCYREHLSSTAAAT